MAGGKDTKFDLKTVLTPFCQFQYIVQFNMVIMTIYLGNILVDWPKQSSETRLYNFCAILP